jgi:Family of unknown function (DUF6159)
MFKRFSNSWELVKASADVLKADKELLVFPIVSAALVLIVTVSFIVPMALVAPDTGDGASALAYVLGFLFYLCSYFVVFFCNSALVGAALIRLRGGDPTVKDGFRIAMEHIGPIFGYALIGATVGIILKALEERAGFLGKIVVSLIGAAWNIATFLVVPILVTEKIGPTQAVRRSVELLKKTWGEQVIGNAGVGFVFGFITFGVILVSIPLILLAVASQSMPLIVAVIGLVVFTIVLLAVINAALTGIYTAAVYRFAAEGDVGHTFNPEMVKGAFRPK